MKFNWVDVVVLLVVVRGVYVGYRSGLSQEFFRFLALIAAYYSALMFHSKAAVFITEHSLIKEKWALALSFVIIASIVFVAVIIFFKIMQKWVKLEFASKLNTLGGAMAGGLRGLIIVSLILFAVFFIPDKFIKKQVYINSYLGHYAIEYTPKIYRKISKKLFSADKLGQSINSRFNWEKKRLSAGAKEDSLASSEKAEDKDEPSSGEGIDDVQVEDSSIVAGPSEEPVEVVDEDLVNRGSEK